MVNTTQKIFPAATIHYSSIIPKISNSTIDICKRINSTLKIFCLQNNVSYIENTHLFVNKYGIKFERLSSYDKIHLNRSSVIAMGKHLKFHLFNVKQEPEEDISQPPYSPSNSNFIVKSIPFSPFFWEATLLETAIPKSPISIPLLFISYSIHLIQFLTCAN